MASPQIRNQGTIGGNVSQDTRCWYYRAGWSCYRAGGNICYADTPTAMNREHAILDADRCVAVNPSDTAPALIALDAQMVIRSASGERVVDAEDYFIGPDRHHAHDRAAARRAADGDPHSATWAGARFYFEKIRDRNVWDFPLLNVASAVTYSADTSSASALWSTARRRGRCACARSRQRSSASRETRRRRSSPGRWRLKGRSRCGTTATRFR